MEFADVSKGVSQWTAVGLAFLAAGLGFGAGWVAHQRVTSRMLQLQPYDPAAHKLPPFRTQDLASAESECPGAATAIIAETPSLFAVDRRALACLLSAPSTSARLAPNLLIAPRPREHSADGFRIWAVRPGSLPARLGLKNGDTIRAINGIPLRSPDSVQSAYARLRSASYVTVNLERQGAQGRSPMLLRYRVFGGPI
jgi:membrane-associated protease RseP (regulator of RpoE activity)